MAHLDWLKRYYRSPDWPLRKALYYKTHRRQCASCGRFDRVALHHTAYGGEGWDLRHPPNWGKEPDDVLVPLCYSSWWRKGCHNHVHRIGRNYPDLRSATEHIVKIGKRRRTRQQQYRRLTTRLGLRRFDQRSRG